MYCKNCHAVNHDDARFCAFCGVPCDPVSPVKIGKLYLVLNILTTLFWFPPLGIIGMIASITALCDKNKGEWEMAKKNMMYAKIMFWSSLALGMPFFFYGHGFFRVYWYVFLFFVYMINFIFFNGPCVT